MNPLIQLKTTPPLLVALALLCFGLLSGAHAVVPAPDGGYPNFTTAEGTKALQNLTTGSANTAVGWFSLESVTTGSFNTATGAGSLLFNTADDNTAFGAAALLSNTTGFQNGANGAFTLFSNTIGNRNTANGVNALFSNTSGGDNTAVGADALTHNTNGNFNTACGWEALANITTGNGNSALGDQAGLNLTTANNVICIGAAGGNVDNSCFIGNIRAATTQNADAIPVLIDSHNQLGTASSSRRFKREIKPMDKASEAILALKPVTFRYKSDKTSTPQFGLIAEQVAEVNRDLVVRDKNGDIYTVRYDQVNAMLLNEFLKEHKKVEEQQATITQLKKEFGATIAQLMARLDEQAAQIQKVSAQLAAASPSGGGLEASKPARQVVNNP